MEVVLVQCHCSFNCVAYGARIELAWKLEQLFCSDWHKVDIILINKWFDAFEIILRKLFFNKPKYFIHFINKTQICFVISPEIYWQPQFTHVYSVLWLHEAETTELSPKRRNPLPRYPTINIPFNTSQQS